MPNGGMSIHSAHEPAGGAAFPVGAVYINVTGVNPATELGYGTWSAFGAGRTLIGLDSGDTDFDTALETGGAKTVAAAGSVAGHTHSVTSNVAIADHTFTQPTISWPAGVPTAANESAHTHTYTGVVAHTHTVTVTDPGHQHSISIQGGGTVNIAGTHVTGSVSAGGSQRDANADSYAKTATTGITAAADSTGSASQTTAAGSSHTHTISWPAGVPTNASGAVDSHVITNNAVTSGSTAPGFTGSATSVVQPYVVVYFWRRTA